MFKIFKIVDSRHILIKSTLDTTCEVMLVIGYLFFFLKTLVISWDSMNDIKEASQVNSGRKITAFQ